MTGADGGASLWSVIPVKGNTAQTQRLKRADDSVLLAAPASVAANMFLVNRGKTVAPDGIMAKGSDSQAEGSGF